MTTEQELQHVDLGHQARNNRLRRLVDDLTHAPESSLPQACRDQTSRAYEFLDNGRVCPQAIREGHYHDTHARLDRRPADEPVLLASDTTSLNYGHHPATQGLGYFQQEGQLGLLCHSTLALDAHGTPLELLQQCHWVRDPKDFGKRRRRRRTATAAKESQRWLDALDGCQGRLPPGRKAVFLADREADFYDLFAHPRRAGVDLLIRAKSRRKLAGEDRLLGAALRELTPAGTLTVTVPRQGDQPERTATLEVRFRTCQIRPPSTHPRRATLAPLPLTVLEVVEVNPPAGEKPLRWLLLTTLPVTTLAEAAQRVQWYAWRWRVERYHFALKSGCRVEQLQLETAARLQRALAVYSIVAVRLLRLTYRARTEPQRPCTVELTEAEARVLAAEGRARRLSTGEPATLTLAGAVRVLAYLGGYQGRGRHARIGVQIVWRGLRNLAQMVRGYDLGQQTIPKRDALTPNISGNA